MNQYGLFVRARSCVFLLSLSRFSSNFDGKSVLQALLFIDIYIMNFSLGCQLLLKLH